MPGYDIIRQAILNRHQIVATYDGYVREMCPHTLGIKDGRQKALFYQFGGGSRSGLGPGGSSQNWRCVFVDELTNVSSREGPWHTAPIHTRRQTCVDQIDVEAT
jgi:hypothetical protein